MNFVNLLKRLAGLDPTAVTMKDDDPFELSPPRSPAAFLRSLPLLGPQPLYLCLEGITDDSLLPLLQQYSVPSQLNVARGIVWPKAALWHVPATSAVLEALACRLDAASQAAPSIHVFLYTSDRVILEWYDAIDSEPLYISRSLSSEAVQAFAHAVGSTLAQGSDHLSSSVPDPPTAV